MIFRLLCFFKQKTAYEMRISDWSSDVCSSDLIHRHLAGTGDLARATGGDHVGGLDPEMLGHPALDFVDRDLAVIRSEERRVGKECVSTCRSRWSLYQ